MGIKLDVLGYRYDDSEPAFTVTESGQFYYHLYTKRLYDKKKFDRWLVLMQKEAGLTEFGFAPGELGLPSDEVVEIGEDQLESLYMFSHTQLRDILPDDHHNKLHDPIDPLHHNFPADPTGKFLKDNGTWGDVTPAGAIETPYNFSIATGGSPASGVIAVNNADQTLADEVHISANNANGNDISPMIGSFNVGDLIGISEDVGSGTAWYEVQAPAVDNTGWFTIAAVYFSGPGGIPDGVGVSTGIVRDPDNKLPAGGDRPAVLKKNSTDNYDFVIENVNHDELDGVTPDNHHPQTHAHDGADDSGTVAHEDLTGMTTDDHHAQEHALHHADHADVEMGTDPVVGAAHVWNGEKFEPLNIFAVAAYGGINLSSPSALPDLGIGYTPLPADVVLIFSPRGIGQDAANNAISFALSGVYNVSINFTLAHNEAQGSREFNARLYNISESEADNGTQIGVGRNLGVTNFSANLLLEIGADQVGDLYRVEIGGGDGFSAVVLETFAFSATGVGEYRG